MDSISIVLITSMKNSYVSLSLSFFIHFSHARFPFRSRTRVSFLVFFSSLKYNIPQRVHLQRVRATAPQNNSRMRGLHKGSCLPANIGRNMYIYIHTGTHLISLRPLNKPSLLILISDFPVDGRESNVCGTTNEEKKSDRYSIKREICPVISRTNGFLPRPFDSKESEDIYPGRIIPFFFDSSCVIFSAELFLKVISTPRTREIWRSVRNFIIPTLIPFLLFKFIPLFFRL